MPASRKKTADEGLALSVVIPTRNEEATVPLLLNALSELLADVPSDIIFVDDSDDATPELVERLGKDKGLAVRLIHREGRRRTGGLSTAALEGMRAADGRYVCIMDADLQHPPELIVAMLAKAEGSGADIVIASRNVKGGSDAGLSGLSRKVISWAAKWLVKLLFPEQLWGVTDPLSGYFLVRRSLLGETALRPIGFKILLDVLIRSGSRHVAEVPLRFAPRAGGVSKATMSQGRDFLVHTLRLLWHVRVGALGRRRPKRAKRARS
jgi:dolichol-phosphate mannosyltransferase